MHAVGVSAFIRRGARFLIVQRSRKDELFPGMWELPGGGVEDESPYTTVAREVKEETGLTVRSSRPVDLFSYNYEGRHAIDIVFAVEADGELRLSEEHDAYAWISCADLSAYKICDELRDVLLRLTAEDQTA